MDNAITFDSFDLELFSTLSNEIKKERDTVVKIVPTGQRFMIVSRSAFIPHHSLTSTFPLPPPPNEKTCSWIDQHSFH